MVQVSAVVRKWGNSLAIVIPSKISKKLCLSEGEKIGIEFREKQKIDGFGLCKGAGSLKREKEEHEEFW